MPNVPINLPHEYTLTLRGREAFERDPNDPLAAERFLLYQDDDMIIYASDSDLVTLGQSEYLVCDGTFKMVPNRFSQLYTIHGFKNSEGKSTHL